MKYVYTIQSIAVPAQRYIGLTSDLDERLRAHNDGKSTHTAKYRRWELVTYLGFEDEQRAVEFERYLKSGSGQSLLTQNDRIGIRGHRVLIKRHVEARRPPA